MFPFDILRIIRSFFGGINCPKCGSRNLKELDWMPLKAPRDARVVLDLKENTYKRETVGNFYQMRMYSLRCCCCGEKFSKEAEVIVAKW